MARNKRKHTTSKQSPPDEPTATAPSTQGPVTGTPPPPWRRALPLAACVLSGCMWFLACADFDIWPLAWVAMAPALWAIDGAPTRRRALAYGWLVGLVANVGGFYWITGLLTRFAQLPMVLAILGLLLLCAYQAVSFLLFAWGVRSLRRISADRLGRPLPWALLAPLVMVTFEMVVPFIFPWYLAITQAWVTPVIQLAELTGPVGISALLIAVSGAVYDAITEQTLRRKLLPGVAVTAVVAATLVFGFVRIGQIDTERAAAPGLMVGVVQGNVGFDEKGILNARLAMTQLNELQATSVALERGQIPAVDRFGRPMAPTGDQATGAELLVWTESSYPYLVPRNAAEDFAPGKLGRVRDGFTSPLIFGAVTMNDGDEYPHNSALMLNSDGQFSGRFDKIFLLMFGEYIPGLETFPWLKQLLPQAAGHFARGKSIVTFPLHHGGADYRIGPMICYEDILPGFGRQLAEHRPHLLVNITNDAWFGDTAEPWEHLALSVYRAVEMRTDLVRSVNTGVSTLIDANGRVYHKTYAMDPGTTDRGSCSGDDHCPGGYSCQTGRCLRSGMDGLLGEVALMGGTDGGGNTFYARFGDLFGWACTLAVFGMWLVWPRLRRRRTS